jgi:hypothetical protein
MAHDGNNTGMFHGPWQASYFTTKYLSYPSHHQHGGSAKQTDTAMLWTCYFGPMASMNLTIWADVLLPAALAPVSKQVL